MFLFLFQFMLFLACFTYSFVVKFIGKHANMTPLPLNPCILLCDSSMPGQLYSFIYYVLTTLWIPNPYSPLCVHDWFVIMPVSNYLWACPYQS